MYDVAYSACQNYEYSEVREALESALAQVTDLKWLREGMTIAIKANLLTSAKPEKAVTTHPMLVCALCDILHERGARAIVGDSSGGVYTKAYMARVYSVCEMDKISEHHGELNWDFTHSEVENPDGKVCHSFDCLSFLQNADAVINLCKLKTHGMMTLTAGVKNLFGAVAGLIKPEYHFRYKKDGEFAEMLVDICQHIAPVLTICDAVVAMEGNGPNSGTPRQIGYIVAATNPHFLDRSLCELIGLAPQRVPTLVAAQSRGLLGEASVCAQPVPVADFRLPDTSTGLQFEGNGTVFGKLRSRVMSGALASRPKLVPEQCIGCRECEKLCPADAIVMRDGKPIINKKACIRCFCCQEFCPRGALVVHRPWIVKREANHCSL